MSLAKKIFLLLMFLTASMTNVMAEESSKDCPEGYIIEDGACKKIATGETPTDCIANHSGSREATPDKDRGTASETNSATTTAPK